MGRSHAPGRERRGHESWFFNRNVTDISPVRALVGLKALDCGGLSTRSGKLSDLLPLQGMLLTTLGCYNTQVSDLSPLEDCKSLTTLSVAKTKVTTAGVAALQKALPNCKIEWDDPAKAKPKLAYLDPAFQQWVAETQKLAAEQQLEAVSKKLMELNPGFDGKLIGSDGSGRPTVRSGVVIRLGFSSEKINDLSPLRALVVLESLYCSGLHGNARMHYRIFLRCGP